MEVGIDLAADGLEALLNKCRGTMDAALSRVGLVGLKNIYGYYHENIGNDDYPFIMVQEAREGLQWAALPNIAENTFNFSIYGFVAHDDPRTCVNGRRALASALKQAVNRFHVEGVMLPDGSNIQFASPNPPISSIDYNVQIFGGTLVRGFVASFSAQIYNCLPEAY